MSRLPSRSGKILIAASVMNNVSVAGHIDDKDVADPPLGTQTGLLASRRASARRYAGYPSSTVRPCPRESVPRPCSRRLAMGDVDDLEAADIDNVLARNVLDLGSGPTRIGMIMPASAASKAPRNEASSQGYTTMVAAADTCLAAAIKRSYFDWAWSASTGFACSSRQPLRCLG